MGKVTIKSIASDLGLSRNTVSMALKGNDLVAPQTREKILRYAVKVGFIEEVPDVSQKETIKEKHTLYHIMILRKSDEAVYWDKVINGITEEASRNYCQTHVAVVSDEEEKNGQFPLGLDEKICAVFCVKLMDWNYVKKIKESGFQIILLDDYYNKEVMPLGDVVRIEGVKAVSFLTRHLIEQGIQKIGFLNENSYTYETMHDRYVGYLDAMNQAGIVVEPNLVMPAMESDHFYFQSTFDRIVEEFQILPDAMVCGNDQIAHKLTLALRKKGLRVPEDVAVTGFDDNEDEMMDPFFSTVHVNAKWLGRRMVQCFLWRMQNQDAPYEKITVSGEVILRKSSCKNRN